MLLQTPYEMAVDTARRFRKVRAAKKITMKSLSERSGVPYSTIRRFESTGEISFLSLVKITSAIGEDDQIASLFAETVPSSIEEIIRGNRWKPDLRIKEILQIARKAGFRESQARETAESIMETVLRNLSEYL